MLLALDASAGVDTVGLLLSVFCLRSTALLDIFIKTPAACGFKKQWHEIVLTLVQAGAWPNAADPRDGCTPHMRAIVANDVDTVEVLLRCAATDSTRRNAAGETAQDLADGKAVGRSCRCCEQSAAAAAISRLVRSHAEIEYARLAGCTFVAPPKTAMCHGDGE